MFHKLNVYLPLLIILNGCSELLNFSTSRRKVEYKKEIINVDFELQTFEDCVNLDSILIEYWFEDRAHQIGYTKQGKYTVVDTAHYTVRTYDYRLSDGIAFGRPIKYRITSDIFLPITGLVSLDWGKTNYVVDWHLSLTPENKLKIIKFDNSNGSTVVVVETDNRTYTPTVSYKSVDYLTEEINVSAAKQFWTEEEKFKALDDIPSGGKLGVVTFGIMLETAVASNHRIVISKNDEIFYNNDLTDYYSIPRAWPDADLFKRYGDGFEINITEAVLINKFDLFVINKSSNDRHTFTVYPDSTFNPNCE